MRAVSLLRVYALAGIVALVGLIAWSSLEMSLGAGLRGIVSTRWGMTTLVDLYLGLFALGAWIGVRERSVVRGVAWTIGLCLLGNLVTLVYFLWACRGARSTEELLLGRWASTGAQARATPEC